MSDWSTLVTESRESSQAMATLGNTMCAGNGPPALDELEAMLLVERYDVEAGIAIVGVGKAVACVLAAQETRGERTSRQSGRARSGASSE